MDVTSVTCFCQENRTRLNSKLTEAQFTGKSEVGFMHYK